jgi:hypothetical protein
MFLYIFYLTLWRERDTTLELTKSNRVGERWIRTELASHLHYFLINNSLAAEYQMFLNSKKLLKTVSVFSIFFRILIPSYWSTGFPTFPKSSVQVWDTCSPRRKGMCSFKQLLKSSKPFSFKWQRNCKLNTTFKKNSDTVSYQLRWQTVASGWAALAAMFTPADCSCGKL